MSEPACGWPELDGVTLAADGSCSPSCRFRLRSAARCALWVASRGPCTVEAIADHLGLSRLGTMLVLERAMSRFQRGFKRRFSDG